MVDFSYVYLLTAPKILGYSFSPATYWYTYSAEQTLTGLVLEVNNTFQERFAYHVKLSEKSTIERDAITIVASKCIKELYVSPFNSLEGEYSISTIDPLATISGETPLNSRISLMTPKGKTKLVASIRSKGPGIKLSALRQREKYRIALSWGWVGLLIGPRIVFEAMELLRLRRRLPMQPQPLAPKEGIG